MTQLRSDERHQPPTAFPVDAVVPADKPVWTESLQDYAIKSLQREPLWMPEANTPVINRLYDDSLTNTAPPQEKTDRLKNSMHFVHRCHPLVEAVDTAFSQHRPLTLSPDCIWLVIEQGFAHHIAENAEALRARLVRHSGSRKLTTNLSEISFAGFAESISRLSTQIREATDPVLHETLTCDFSTTTPDIRTASEIVLMDSFSAYFEYMMTYICGIPSITVTGTIDDWRRIRSRIEVLATYSLEWWVARLRPILDEFIRTVEGHPSLEFWQAIYKPKEAYGTSVVTGWLADLFPYLNDAPKRVRSPLFNYSRENWAVPVERGISTLNTFEVLRNGLEQPGSDMGVSRESFPSGLAKALVTVNFKDNSTRQVDLVGGFLAVEQDVKTLALSPLISWCVIDHVAVKVH